MVAAARPAGRHAKGAPWRVIRALWCEEHVKALLCVLVGLRAQSRCAGRSLSTMRPGSHTFGLQEEQKQAKTEERPAAEPEPAAATSSQHLGSNVHGPQPGNHLAVSLTFGGFARGLGSFHVSLRGGQRQFARRRA